MPLPAPAEKTSRTLGLPACVALQRLGSLTHVVDRRDGGAHQRDSFRFHSHRADEL